MTFQTKRKKTNKRKQPENDACRAWLQWLKLQHPKVFEHVIKIDNEGTTNRANAVSLGLHPGASDYLLAYATQSYPGLFIEAKPDGWKLTPSKQPHYNRQMLFHAKMRKQGYCCRFCVGVDEMIKATQEYLRT